MLLSKRVTRLLLASLLVFLLYLVLDQYLYENFLVNRSITFQDFPPSYSNALKDAVDNDKPLEFDYSLFPRPANESETIPPIIHFIWFKDLYPHQLNRPDHPSHIPTEGSQAPALCREHNPSFTINLWNSTSAHTLLSQHYPWFLPTYTTYAHPIQRIDALKYILLHHYGGIYMDLDIACRRNLEPLLGYEAWFPKANPFGLNNDLFAAKKGHALMEFMVKRLEGRNVNLLFPYVTIFWSTGPQFASDMVRKWWHKGGKADSDSDLNDLSILPPEFYSEEYTFFGHSPGGTWHGEDVATVLWLVDRPWVVLLLSAAIVTPCGIALYRRRKRRLAQAAVKLEEA